MQTLQTLQTLQTIWQFSHLESIPPIWVEVVAVSSGLAKPPNQRKTPIPQKNTNTNESKPETPEKVQRFKTLERKEPTLYYKGQMRFFQQQNIIYVIVVSLFFILFCFIFPQQWNPWESPVESFTDIQSGIQSVFQSRRSLSLNQYMMMASYDSAYDGTTVSVEQLTKVISSGCRVFDFQIFCEDSISDSIQPYIGYSTDPTFVSIQGVDSNISKRLTFNKVLATLVSGCFGTVAPNNNDPVFIHLRVKSKNTNVFSKLATSIEKMVSSRLYVDPSGKVIPISKDTPLEALMGKILFIMDRTFSKDYGSFKACHPGKEPTAKKDASGNAVVAPTVCISLEDYINIESGGTQWRQIAYNPPEKLNCLTQGGLKSPLVDESTDNMGIVLANNSNLELFMVMPPENILNLDIVGSSVYVSRLACQTLWFRFYNQGPELLWYLGLFELYKTAFIPMGFAITATNTVKFDSSILI